MNTTSSLSVAILVGSLREGSLSRALASQAASLLLEQGHAVEVLAQELGELPFYHAEIDASGASSQIEQLRERVGRADLVLVVSPEYNGHAPGLLSNALDWLSRPHQAAALAAKPTGVLTQSPGPLGGVRAGVHLRTLLGNIGAELVPGMLNLGSSSSTLDEAATALELMEFLELALTHALVRRREPAALAH